METNYIIHENKAAKIITLNHGCLFSRKKEILTSHCPRCFRNLRNNKTEQCTCGQYLIRK